MSCAALHTGTGFLATSLAHLDCQGRSIGAYGYGALADPNSTVAVALTALLTVFIALFGIRLMWGSATTGRDIIGEFIRMGIVLTLATSWPAWRAVGYDLVLDGPDEIARAISAASGLSGTESSLIKRLQSTDNELVVMTMYGTGRLTGGVVGGSDLGDSFHGVAMADETGFAWGRVAFLSGVIAPFAITRIGAGILLALAPLMAGLLLFVGTRSLFVGWLRGLAFVALGSLALSITNGVELALIGPWISDVLAQRGNGAFAPSAPTELVVLTCAFALFSVAMLVLAALIAFYPQWGMLEPWTIRQRGRHAFDHINDRPEAQMSVAGQQTHSRAQGIADSVSLVLRREEAGGMLALHSRGTSTDAAWGRGGASGLNHGSLNLEPIGSGYRRTRTRTFTAGVQRDKRS